MGKRLNAPRVVNKRKSKVKAYLSCLIKGCKGQYQLTNMKDRNGIILLKCNRCGDLAI